MLAPHQHVHHFCRWLLPQGHSPHDALAKVFPGASPAEASAALDLYGPRQLREVFGGIFGAPTTSNNTAWIRAKVKQALGLGSSKRGYISRKRARLEDEDRGTRNSPRTDTPSGESSPPSPPLLRRHHHHNNHHHHHHRSPAPAAAAPWSPAAAAAPAAAAPWSPAAAAAAAAAAQQWAEGAGGVGLGGGNRAGSRGGDNSNSTAFLQVTGAGVAVGPGAGPLDGASALLAAAAQVDGAAAAVAAMPSTSALAAAGPAAAAPTAQSLSEDAVAVLSMGVLLCSGASGGDGSGSGDSGSEGVVLPGAAAAAVSAAAAAAAAAGAQPATFAASPGLGWPASVSTVPGSDTPTAAAAGNCAPAAAPEGPSLATQPAQGRGAGLGVGQLAEVQGPDPPTNINPWQDALAHQLEEVKRQLAVLRLLAVLAGVSLHQAQQGQQAQA